MAETPKIKALISAEGLEKVQAAFAKLAAAGKKSSKDAAGGQAEVRKEVEKTEKAAKESGKAFEKAADKQESSAKDVSAAFARVSVQVAAVSARITASMARASASMSRSVASASARMVKSLGTVSVAAGKAGLGKATSGLKATALAATAAGGALGFLTHHAAGYSAAISEGATRTGMAIDKFSKLAYAGRAFGAETEDMASAVATLSERITEAAILKESTALEAFGFLGVTATKANGELKDSYQLFMEIADAFARMPDGAVKTKAAFDIFSDDARYVMPLLNKGSAAIRQMGRDADKLGLIVSPKQSAAAKAYKEQIARLGGAFEGIAVSVGRVFMPLIEETANSLSTFLANNRTKVEGVAKSIFSFVKSISTDIGRMLDDRPWKVQNRWLVAFQSGLRFIRDLAEDVYILFGGKMNRGIKNQWLLDLKKGIEFVWDTSVKFLKALTDGKEGDTLADYLAAGFSKLGTIIGDVFKLIFRNGDGVQNGWVSSLYNGVQNAGKALLSLVNTLVFGKDGVTKFGQSAGNTFERLLGAVNQMFIALQGENKSEYPWMNAIGQGIHNFLASVRSVFAEAFTIADNFFKSVNNQTLDPGYEWVGEYQKELAKLWEGFVVAADVAFKYVQGLFENLWKIVKGGRAEGEFAWLNDVVSSLKSIISGLQTAAEAMKAVSDAHQSFYRKLGEIYGRTKNEGASGLWDSITGGSNPPGYATGGHVLGPGTGTSDSILARLSRGEFVIRAKRVKELGLGFLHKLNSGSWSGSMRSGLPAFASGGLVQAMPAAASAGRPVNFNFADGTRGTLYDQDGSVGRLKGGFIRSESASFGSKPRQKGLRR